jgi:NADPH:quinone reductase-like Zn-dependent oxidoreductase
MRADRIHAFGGPDVLSIDDVPVPEPKDTEMLVRVVAASVNPVDYKIRSGHYPPVQPNDLPKILGRDVAGTVERIGKAVTAFRPGDEIYAMLGRDAGGYADYTTVTEKEAARKPQTLDFVQAAAVPLAALTAWQGLFDHGALRRHQRVLIHGGAGGVGHFAVQFAKLHGAWVATTVSADDMQLARQLGADRPIDYKSEKFEDAVNDIDLVLDLIGGETQKRSWKVLKDGGVFISSLQLPDQDEAERRKIRAANYMAHPSADELTEIGRLIDLGDVRVVINAVYPLEDVAKAHEHMEHDHIQGKVVLKVAA